YTDSRTVQIPVGHETYQANICEISGWDSLHLYQDTEQTETHETTYTATFPSTIYGGSHEFVSGKAESEWGYIASYNGETLPGEWMSDRDVYEPNTTPTTGAEVAYKLTAPTEITLTPEIIALLKGNNTMWTDGDSIELKYTKLALPDDSDGLSLNQKVRKAIEIIKGKAINEELKKEETKKSTTKGRRKKP
ncbi:MAG: hypothetical protein IIZ41_06905, partial [Lachnospiraceae bacterium]|nr:hypothetical protein [Lachnospiraceae bacterium]